MLKKETISQPEKNVKLTEDETIRLLVQYLKTQGYTHFETCTGHQRGTDIAASCDDKVLHVEVKGARGNPKSHFSIRSHFDSGQIKTHFGKAIVKALDLQSKHPNDQVAIAHPDDPYIRKVIGRLIPRLSELNLLHFWVTSNKGEIE